MEGGWGCEEVERGHKEVEGGWRCEVKRRDVQRVWMGSRGGGVERGNEWRQRGWWREVMSGGREGGGER